MEEIITKLNDIKARIDWWVNYKAEAQKNNNKNAILGATSVTSTLSSEYCGMVYVLDKFGYEIELGTNGKITVLKKS